MSTALATVGNLLGVFCSEHYRKAQVYRIASLLQLRVKFSLRWFLLQKPGGTGFSNLHSSGVVTDYPTSTEIYYYSGIF